MFLNELTGEEKVMFLDMASYVSKANGFVDETEEKVISQYCLEMGLEPYDASKIHSLEEIKSYISNASDASKRIFVLELLGLGYIDGSFDNLEDSMMNDFASSIGLTKEVYEMLKRDVEEYTTVLGIIQDHIFEQ